MIKEGNRVKVKDGVLYLGGKDNHLSPDRTYEVEKVQGSDIYVKGRINYFRLEHLELA